MWKCLYISQRIFFSTLHFYRSPSPALCSFPPHTQTMLSSNSSLIYSIQSMFRLKMMFVPKLPFLFMLCVFVRSCVSNWLLNWHLSSPPPTRKEMASFLKVYLLTTSSWVLRLKYKSNYFLTVMMIKVVPQHCYWPWNWYISVRGNMMFSVLITDSLNQIAMVWTAHIMTHCPIPWCCTAGHSVGVVGGDRWRPAASRAPSVILKPLKMLNAQL